MAKFTLTKICTKCNTEKSVSSFCKDSHAKDGLSCRCRACAKQYAQERKEEKRTYNKQYRKQYRERIAVYDKQYAQEHREKKRASCKRYNQEHKEEMRQYYKERREEIAIYRKQYRQTPEGKIANAKSKQKRRTLKYGVDYEDFTHKEILGRDDYMCQICGVKTRPDYKNPHHPLYPNLDHIIPLCKGGHHTKQNTQCLCRHCNAIKSSNIIGKEET